MPTAIRVEGVGKKYTIRHQGRPEYRMIREEIANRVRGIGRFLKPSAGGRELPRQEEFWALRNINLEVVQGERVGIIGRNGAGKSTLLKLLSRITEPTEGRISIQGRVGSLLEVGTGFHPEMTGRENIYLNGSVLGMKRSEIQQKFDEIVAFAGIERFLDTPVKRYSSGMYVRLAFSVAAHLEPQILIVDEVLAVGDYEFQKKCLGKMESVSRTDGRTVLFVSHNVAAIETLCNRAILLKGGNIVADSADLDAVLDCYHARSERVAVRSAWHRKSAQFDSGYFRPTFFGVIDDEGQEIRGPVRNNEQFHVCVMFECDVVDPSLVVGYAVYDHQDNIVFNTATTDVNPIHWPTITAGVNRLLTDFPQRFLNEGTYKIELVVSLYGHQWLIAPQSDGPAVELSIEGGLSDSPQWISRRSGVTAPVILWTRAEP